MSRVVCWFGENNRITIRFVIDKSEKLEKPQHNKT